MNYKYKLGIIGAGNMASAIIDGILDSNLLKAEEIIISDKNESMLNKFCNIANSTQNKDVLQNSEYVLFAVKPQIFKEITSEIKENIKSKVAISIMAGINSQFILNCVGESTKVVRIMPNTPCQIGLGMSAIQKTNLNSEEKQFVFDVFNSVGKTIELEESLFDAVTSISGSGPAYAFLFLKAMIDGGIEGGLSADQSKLLACQTILGAVQLAQNSEISIDKLIDAVCSKGGTTIEAIEHFKSENLEEIVKKGIKKCKDKSEILGKA